MVSPQNWLFLTTYRKLRERLLKGRTWNLVARLGPGAFETITGHVVNVALNILSAGRADLGWEMAGVDVSAPRGQHSRRAAEKGELLRGGGAISITRIPQDGQLRNPDAIVRLEIASTQDTLTMYASCLAGILNGDSLDFGVLFPNSVNFHPNG